MPHRRPDLHSIDPRYSNRSSGQPRSIFGQNGKWATWNNDFRAAWRGSSFSFWASVEQERRQLFVTFPNTVFVPSEQVAHRRHTGGTESNDKHRRRGAEITKSGTFS